MQIKELTHAHLDDILTLETECFAPCLRADRETLLKRFRLGHIMLGLFEASSLIGVASFSYRHFHSEAQTRHFCENHWRIGLCQFPP